MQAKPTAWLRRVLFLLACDGWVGVPAQGPLDDQYAQAIRNCDANGPLMVYVSKMIPAADKGRFFAFGRVFAGKVAISVRTAQAHLQSHQHTA